MIPKTCALQYPKDIWIILIILIFPGQDDSYLQQRHSSKLSKILRKKVQLIFVEG
jgi:hypothetical protein